MTDKSPLLFVWNACKWEKTIQKYLFFNFQEKTSFDHVNELNHCINSVFLLYNMGINEFKQLQILGIAQLQQKIVGGICSK